jgi:hypothetical protein
LREDLQAANEHIIELEEDAYDAKLMANEVLE